MRHALKVNPLEVNLQDRVLIVQREKEMADLESRIADRETKLAAVIEQNRQKRAAAAALAEAAEPRGSGSVGAMEGGTEVSGETQEKMSNAAIGRSRSGDGGKKTSVLAQSRQVSLGATATAGDCRRGESRLHAQHWAV